MKFKAIIFITVLIYSVSALLCQDFQQDDKYKEIFQMLGSQSGQRLNNFTTTMQLNISINPDEYFVDVGDVFIIKIDVKGPASKIFTASVFPEGFLMLEDVPSVRIKKMSLNSAKKRIIRSIRSKYSDAVVEVFLYSIHKIEVTVLGAIKYPGVYELKSSDRLYAAYKIANEEKNQATYKNNKLSAQFPIMGMQEFENMQGEILEQSPSQKELSDSTIALRNVLINRNNKKLVVDLLKFERKGKKTQNPYLQNGDIIYFPYIDKEKYLIQVHGAVGNQIKYEYKINETLGSAIGFAGGLLPSADSSNIKLFRFKQNSLIIDTKILSFPGDSSLLLNPDDRIFVRFKPEFHIKNAVKLMGEIKYPGSYAIVDGETTLSEIIKQAGEFTDRASLKNSVLIRSKYLPEDRELKRLRKMSVSEMTDIELSYLKLRTRENLRMVSVDFEKLFKEKVMSENVILRDGDVIMIPEIKNIVYVSGGVTSPGNITFHPNWTYLEYINSAGGFNLRAIEGKTQIIKNKTGVWLDADEEDIVIEEGDIIFVPEEVEINWYNIFKETMTITAQLATITLLIVNLVK